MFNNFTNPDHKKQLPKKQIKCKFVSPSKRTVVDDDCQSLKLNVSINVHRRPLRNDLESFIVLLLLLTIKMVQFSFGATFPFVVCLSVCLYYKTFFVIVVIRVLLYELNNVWCCLFYFCRKWSNKQIVNIIKKLLLGLRKKLSNYVACFKLEFFFCQNCLFQITFCTYNSS